MHQQNQIKRTLALPKSIEVVRTLLNSQAHKNRASLSRTVCQQRREHLHRVLLHSTFVVSTEGLPLGLLQAQFSAPQPKSKIDTRPADTLDGGVERHEWMTTSKTK